MAVKASVGADTASAEPEHTFPDGDRFQLKDSRASVRSLLQSTFNKRATTTGYTLHAPNPLQEIIVLARRYNGNPKIVLPRRLFVHDGISA